MTERYDVPPLDVDRPIDDLDEPRARQLVEGLPGRRDSVNHPPHYTHGHIEPIEVIEDWKLGFHLGTVLKYIARAEHKGAPVEDLQKARWYLDREIKRRQGE